jgi:cbb3-type cytochrome oxidase maturation protein
MLPACSDQDRQTDMDVLPLLIIISLGVLGLAVWLFFRMSDSGQFDDVESPAQRILLDDDRVHDDTSHAPSSRSSDKRD